MSILLLLAGVAIVTVTGLDVFQTVIVPRPTGIAFRSSVLLTRSLWRFWRRGAYRIADNERRESYLGAFAPLVLVLFLVFWIASLVVGYGLMFFALRAEIKPMPDLFEAIYFAGTSLVTIGFGDFAPTGVATRVLSLFAGASGLGAFAIITAFIFPIFGAYQRREAFVVMFTNRAGAPPSGVDLIEAVARSGSVASLSGSRDSELWLAEMMETHLAYPILTYFRSTHDDISWVAVLGTILDASTLTMTTLDLDDAGEAKIVNRLGRHFVNDFTRYFHLPPGRDVGIERSEFDTAYDRLNDATIPLRERERAWQDFARIRATYARQLNEMAKYWSIPPAQWFGDRSLIQHHGVREFDDENEGATP